MADGQTSSIGGVSLRRSGLPFLSTGCQGFRRHDGNRRHELRSLAVYSSTSIGGNNLDLWFLDGTQLRCRSERTNRDESRRQRYWSKSRKHALSARRRYWPTPCGPLILTLIRGRCACGPK